ncbi:MAG: T9SS type A sorting domain-containing protein [Candidatus Kapabacteria bacterium]|nr:T9SS type A sorting domain-containing protein [Candidatus Kapabacteria bacterium]
MKYFLFLLLYILSARVSDGQIPETSRGYALLLTPVLDSTSGRLDAIFTWDADTNAYSYTVFMKFKEDSLFGDPIKTISRFDSQYVFTDFERGRWYEFLIEKDMIDYFAYGYMNIGIDVPAIEHRGNVLILVDESIDLVLNDKIERLSKDMFVDGWRVFRDTAPRAETFDSAKVMQTKGKIIEYYNKENITAVLLFGRIAVPYSGSFAVDGHTPDHDGAWASDIFYGDVDGIWTDTLTNLKSDDERTRNRPNDGKFDQIIIPSDIEIAVGRVDMFNLPFFEKNELELLEQYLDKNHRFRTGIDRYPDKMIVSDAFGPDLKEGFAASAWMSFSAMTDWREIDDEDLRDMVSDNDYIWGYGCGPGSFVRAERVAYAEDFASKPMRVAFTQLFGSYFGDWDSENNLMRAALAAAPGGLICVWSGRPHWFFHHTAFGESIAYSTLLSQNSRPNNYRASSPYARRMNHIALIGDPTLKTSFVQSPSNLAVTSDSQIHLSWDESPDSNIIGYYVYSSDEKYGQYQRISDEIVTTTSFTDVTAKHIWNYYMVRAIKEERLHSGTYLNLSQGVISEEGTLRIDLTRDKVLNTLLYPNPASDNTNLVIVTDLSGVSEIKLFDLSRKLLNKLSINISEFVTKKNILLTDAEGNSLASGVYYIEISINGVVRHIKFMIID